MAGSWIRSRQLEVEGGKEVNKELEGEIICLASKCFMRGQNIGFSEGIFNSDEKRGEGRGGGGGGGGRRG